MVAITKLFKASFLISKKTVVEKITISVNTIIALTETPPILDSLFIIFITP